MVIRRHPQRAPSGYLQQAPEEPSGGRPIAVLTEHRVEQLSIAINRAVEVAPTTSDLHVRLVQIPRPAAATITTHPKIGADQRREAELPGADRLVADGVAALQQEFRYIPQPKLLAQAPEHGE